MKKTSTTLAAWVCPNCGRSNTHAYCGYCGSSIPKQEPARPRSAAGKAARSYFEPERIFFAAVVTVLAALCSGWPIIAVTPVPGLLFGLSFLTWRGSVGRKIAAIGLSTVAYWIAFVIAVRTGDRNALGVILAGFFGAGTLWGSLAVLKMLELRMQWLAITLVLGSIAALAFQGIAQNGGAQLILPFAVWQILMGAWLAFLVERKMTLKPGRPRKKKIA
jgi:hypothetical protein